MNKKILFSIFTLLLLFVIVLLAVLLNNSDNGLKDIAQYPNSPKNKNSISNTAFTSWTKKLSNYKQRDFMMPVTDLFVSIKFKTKAKKENKKREKFFKLIVSNLDNYSLFCILQIFKNEKLPFVIQKGNGNSQIYISTNKKNDLENISNELKRYDINSKIKLVEK